MMTRQEAIKAAGARLRCGCPPPEKLPKSLPLPAIKIDSALFQWRGRPQFANTFHIAELTKTPKEGTPLAAVDVWWGGDGYYLIDGHHRVEAYKAAKWQATKLVPVAVYRGSLTQALLKAGHGNTPDKLGMTKEEKTQAAWEFVAATPVEAARAEAIQRAYSVSERMVRYMRSVVRQLRERDPSEDLSALTWLNARATIEGRATREMVDFGVWQRDEADRLEALLREALGKVRPAQREALADAFERVMPGGVAFFADYWRMRPEEAEENPDF